MASEQVYLAHRATIDRAIAAVCRRHRLRPQDAEDFGGHVRLHLIENDYAVLRKFAGRSSIATYLAAVIAHRFQDWRNAHWGKWRPSAEARRLGEVAVRLETLMVRDGLSFDEAHETLRTNYGAAESRERLEAFAARFPTRAARQSIGEERLAELPAPAAAPDVLLEQGDHASRIQAAARSLSAAVAGLDPQDRLVLKMRFEDDVSIADIARALGLDQKALYRRVDRLLADLRAALERRGWTPAAAGDLLAYHYVDTGNGGRSGEFWGEVRPFDTGAARSSVQKVRTP